MRTKKYLKTALFILAEGLHLAWLIYGNVLYYGREDNCSNYSLHYYLMYFIILLGYLDMLAYLLVCILVTLILVYRMKHNSSKKKGAITILRGLSKIKFNRDLISTNENECSICWGEYEEN